MANSVSLRPAAKADIPVIHALAGRIWRTHYPGIITHEQIDYMLEKMYSPESLSRQMENGDRYFMVEAGGMAIGYISVVQRAPGEYFLSKFYIEAMEQAKGYGKDAFRQMLAFFPDLRTMRLQVNRRNFKSVNFYFRLGFTIEEAKDFDIGDGYSMDDFVMLLVKES